MLINLTIQMKFTNTLKVTNSPKLTQEELEAPNNCVTAKLTGLTVTKLPTKDISGCDDFTSEFYQIITSLSNPEKKPEGTLSRLIWRPAVPRCQIERPY